MFFFFGEAPTLGSLSRWWSRELCLSHVLRMYLSVLYLPCCVHFGELDLFKLAPVWFLVGVPRLASPRLLSTSGKYIPMPLSFWM